MLKKVFQPFFTTKEEGSGLGLSIVDRIIREHGGHVGLQSKEGQGTTFTILPTHKQEPNVSTILIIDDDDQLRKSFAKVLTGEGYNVEIAASGEAGLRKVEEALPDLVVLDVRLPGMNGLETFKRIHAIEHRLPVIIMTAFGTTEDSHRGNENRSLRLCAQTVRRTRYAGNHQAGAGRGPFHALTTVAMNARPGDTANEAIIGRSGAMQEVYKSIGARVSHRRHGPDQGRFRHRQGAGGPGALPAQPAVQKTFSGDQLRGHSRDASGKRALRLRKRRLYGRQPPARGQNRTGIGRHYLPGRNRRHAHEPAGENAAAAPGEKH